MQSILNTAIMKMALQLARTQAWWRVRIQAYYRFCLNGMCTLVYFESQPELKRVANACVPVERSVLVGYLCSVLLVSQQYVGLSSERRTLPCLRLSLRL